jgi:hypothetical protein
VQTVGPVDPPIRDAGPKWTVISTERPLYGAFVLRGILYVVYCFQIDARFGLEPPHEWKQAEAGTEAIALGWDRGLRIGLEVDLGK